MSLYSVDTRKSMDSRMDCHFSPMGIHMESQGHAGTAQSVTRPTGAPSLDSALWDINRRCLELMVRSAQQLDQPHATYLIGALHNRLVALSPEQIETVARSPFLLVTVCFQQPDWWQSVSSHPGSRHAHGPWRRYFPKSAAIRMTRATLFLAWHATQTAPDFAAITLGLDPKVIPLIRALNLHSIDQIADHQHQHLMPRWEDRPFVWKHLVDASSNAADQTAPFTLHGLQLIAGEYLGKRPHR
jgi:hypothetical protein